MCILAVSFNVQERVTVLRNLSGWKTQFLPCKNKIVRLSLPGSADSHFQLFNSVF